MKKNFLFISPWINPFEPYYGAAQRSYLLLRALLECGNVDVVVFRDEIKLDYTMNGCEVIHSHPVRSSRPISRAKKWFGLLMPWDPYSFYPVDEGKEAVIDGLVSKKTYDAIVVRYIPDAMSCGLMKYADRLVIDVDDHPKDQLKMMAQLATSGLNKLYHSIASSLSSITVNCLVNRIKAGFFSNPNQVVGRHGAFLPNVPLEEPSADYVMFNATTPRLFFVGYLDYYPNYSGLDFFVENVWPMVKATVPEAEFHIAGKIVGESSESYRRKWEEIEGVSVLGFVEDIKDEYDTCRATVSPIYVGAGTNIKLVESIQRKRVCVTTNVGVRGMKSFFVSGEEVLVANNAKEYAQLCIQALTDESFNHQIARNAYMKMKDCFSHEAFNQIVKNALG